LITKVPIFLLKNDISKMRREESMKKHLFLTLLFFAFILPLSSVAEVDTHDTRLLTQPAISQAHIAFVYANDLWLANLDGKEVRRLTSDLGVESNPRFSPDGRLIAFSAQYDGNTDVYLIPAEGGIPKRLTWHPGFDIVQGFTPDGSSVLFISNRNSANYAAIKLFKVSVQGGFPEELKIPSVYRAVYSPDGSRIAYNPLPDAFNQWKHYRGGRISEIWILRNSDYSVEKVPQPEGRSNDVGAMWIEDKIYFRSDRNGEFNLFSFDPKTKEIKQLTNHTDFPVLSASAGGGKIIYEQAGYLHIYDPETVKSTKLTIGVAADLLELRERYVKGARWVRNASISPSGARAVFEFRGEIVTVPAEKGDYRNITNTPGAQERSPLWSPDGKSIAYFSDESGEYELCVKSQDGKGDAKKYKLNGAGFYDSPVWSPDNQKISYADNSWSLYWVDLKTGISKKIGSEYYYGPARFRAIPSAWSPDSKWIVYTLHTEANIQRVYVYSLERDKSYPITDGLSEVSEPVFDASGKYLYFFASTDAGPIKQWFDLSNADMRMTNVIYVAVLRKDVPSPLAKESDEEKGVAQKEEKKEDKAKEEAKAKDKDKDKKEEQKPAETFSIDFEGLNHRILALPLPEGYYWNLQAGEEGQLYYQEQSKVGGGEPIEYSQSPAAVHRYDFKKRKDEVIVPEVNYYQLSVDKKKILYMFKEMWAIVDSAAKAEPGKGKLNLESIEVKINPSVEWNQIFNEVFRINRDYFYDPKMHGANWNALKEKYAAFLPHLSCRNDLNRLIQWLCSELVVGHTYSGGGDQLAEPKKVPGGLLGADFSIENGRYRFKKVFGGLNWNPELRSPLTEPGVDVREGEYLLAVGGKDLRPPTDIYSMFENTAGKIVEITVSPNPEGNGSRTVSVVPIADESALRNRDWVEGNLKKVEEATAGRVAYVYVPNTANMGHTYFKRYFFPQANKDAIIVDERFNGGGSLADYYIDILRRPFQAMWATRYGADIRTPGASILGPKVMLINEPAGSGGDFLPWMFRKFGLGKLIGKRTWGGLVGILGFPVLMDGGYITAPNIAIWTEDGWIVENEGVPPDIEVEQWPAEVAAGHDPQLEKAIQVVMEELRANPPKKLKRPPFPVRVK
jgi:tricorn protease